MGTVGGAPGGAPESRSALIKRWALEAGFDRAGVAVLGPAETGPAFERWLERGDHAEMRWLERGVERRLDPGRVLEGARSAVCVALHYAPLAGGAEPSGDLWPAVARYARGADYHGVMGRGLEILAQRVESAFPGARTRAYVDTGPILERDLAQRAGLGRIGKNTNLLHRWGSWFLIGELLSTLELEPDQPLADMCGACTRCLDACPTGALPEPYRLDSRRCLSYWTIEHRGDLPEDLREPLADWVFGCDVCQEVCPWNGRADRDGQGSHDHPELGLGEPRAGLDLEGLLGLDRDGYVALFRGSPMKRARLEGLQRNAAVAMGARRRHGYAAALARALENESPLVRRHAAWGLARTATGGGALRARLRREGDASVRTAILEALRRGEDC